MLRRLRTLTRARLTPDDVEGRIHLRPFPAFYFNDKKTMTLSVRVDTISGVHKNFLQYVFFRKSRQRFDESETSSRSINHKKCNGIKHEQSTSFFLIFSNSNCYFSKKKIYIFYHKTSKELLKFFARVYNFKF